jgi:hypothetical protein
MHIDKLDIDQLYDEAEMAGRFGVCSSCDEEHVLCFCGVCFKYCHDDYMHAESSIDPMDEALAGLA